MTLPVYGHMVPSTVSPRSVANRTLALIRRARCSTTHRPVHGIEFPTGTSGESFPTDARGYPESIKAQEDIDCILRKGTTRLRSDSEAAALDKPMPNTFDLAKKYFLVEAGAGTMGLLLWRYWSGVAHGKWVGAAPGCPEG